MADGRSNEVANPLVPVRTMSNNCPGCGSPVEFESHRATLMTGTCASCGHHWTAYRIETGDAASSDEVEVLEEDDELTGADEEATPAPVPSGPPCPNCGGTLTFRSAGGPAVEATCGGCGKVTSYLPASEAPARPPRERPTGDRPVGPGFRGSNARPCRECGGPLSFSTAPDGTITGECASCGNRFTLPPRREFRGGWQSGPNRYDRGRPRDRYGSRPPGRPFRKPGGGGYRRREDRNDEDDEERPRRRTRRT